MPKAPAAARRRPSRSRTASIWCRTSLRCWKRFSPRTSRTSARSSRRRSMRTWDKPSSLAHHIGRRLSRPKPTSVGSGGWRNTSRFGPCAGSAGPARPSPAILVSRAVPSSVTCGTKHFPSAGGAAMSAGAGLIAGSRSFWNAGCRNSRRLFHEIQRQGYRGSYPTLARYTQRLRQAQESAVRKRGSLPPVGDPHRQPLTPRTAAWLVLRHAEHRDATDAEQLSRLRTQHAALTEAIILAEEFVAMIHEGQAERFDPWLAQARDSTLPAFRNFARKIDSDDDAVRGAVTSPWSTGQVEGQINRLKMIKRQMFGRASFDLLNRRFILAT